MRGITGVHRTLVLGSNLCRVQGRNRASRGLRPGRDQKPTVAGPKDMWMALRAKPRLIDVEFPARQHHEDLKSGTTNIKK